MGNFLTPVLLKLDPEPSIPVVVLTGILLVFLILVLLTVIITIQGKIFDGIAAKQAAEKEAQAAAASAATASPRSRTFSIPCLMAPLMPLLPIMEPSLLHPTTLARCRRSIHLVLKTSLCAQQNRVKQYGV